MQEKTQRSQVKSELQLNELNKAAEFITKKFDQYKAERKEKEKIINDLQGKVSELSNELEELNNSLERRQQYSRRNWILIHRISEQKGRDTDLDRTNRIGAFKEDKNKCRPIIVRSSRYNVRDKVSKNIKKLKDKGYSITESLTDLRMKNLCFCNSFGFTNVWTQDEKILCKEDNRIKAFFD